MRSSQLRSIKQAELRNRRVLIRMDLDVPMKGRQIADDSRLRSALPTLRYLRKHKARIIIMGHLGRPKGKEDPSFSIRPVARKLTSLIKQPIKFADQILSAKTAMQIKKMGAGELLMLENLRFHPGEGKNTLGFANQLARFGDCFVHESFGNSHRNHASMVGVTPLLPSYAGLQLLREVEILSAVMTNPKRPFVAVIGGAKISSKASTIKQLLKIADCILIGGALANTFLYAQEHPVGRSLVEKNLTSMANDLISNRLRIPIDVVTASNRKGNNRTVKAVGSVGRKEFIYDIGSDTVKLYSEILRKAKTIIWGGPMGYFEHPSFAKGTVAIAKAVASSKAYSVAGGGETIEAIRKARVSNRISFISMGGGAMMTFLSGKKILSIELLKK